MLNVETTQSVIPIDLKSVGAAGEISGYLSTYDELDQGGDIVVKGAFDDILTAHKQSGVTPKMLWQHDPSRPIGIWDSLHSDNKGLYGSGRLLLDLPLAKDAHTLIKSGAIDGISIGYRTLDFDRNEKGNRLLKKLQLVEASIVTFPMNTSSTVDDVKNLSTIRDAERLLRDAGVPAKFAKLIVSHGFDEAKAILNGQQRDAESEEELTKDAARLLAHMKKLKESLHV